MVSVKEWKGLGYNKFDCEAVMEEQVTAGTE